MAERTKYYVEVFVQDFHGGRTSLGKHETYVENWTLCVEVTPSLALSNFVRAIHLEFSEMKKECPRCHKKTLEDEQALNSLSRRGDIYICNPCGDDEALIDSGVNAPTETEVKFIEWLKLNLP